MAEVPRVGINGFGRIGRLVTRALLERGPPVDLVAINDLSNPDMLAHLFKHDSVHGRFSGPVEVLGEDLSLAGDRVRITAEADPADLPWDELGADIVVECTGRFRRRGELQKHLDAGAGRVILSAPGDVDVTLVKGVNDVDFDPGRHRLVSNASCTTNCLAVVLKVLHEAFKVRHASMTTVHGYTNDQRLLDSQHSDPRRSRAAALSMIPTTTGAASAIGLVIPELAGRVDGLSIRVPTPNVSLVDLTAEFDSPVSVEAMGAAFDAAAAGPLQGILRCERQSLVSVDFNGDSHSAVVDLPGSMALSATRAKVLAWYDNEWAYACRTAELVHDVWGAERGA